MGMYAKLCCLEARLIRFVALDELENWSSGDCLVMIFNGSLLSNSKYPLTKQPRLFGSVDVISLKNIRRLDSAVKKIVLLFLQF